MPDDVTRLAHALLQPFAAGVHAQFVDAVLDRVARLTPGRIHALGAGAFAYSVLFLVEGTGLWRQRRWAEYLTVVATLTFVPFEIYELVTGVSATKITALAVNIAMVAYLGVRLWRGRYSRRPSCSLQIASNSSPRADRSVVPSE